MDREGKDMKRKGRRDGRKIGNNRKIPQDKET